MVLYFDSSRLQLIKQRFHRVITFWMHLAILTTWTHHHQFLHSHTTNPNHSSSLFLWKLKEHYCHAVSVRIAMFHCITSFTSQFLVYRRLLTLTTIFRIQRRAVVKKPRPSEMRWKPGTRSCFRSHTRGSFRHYQPQKKKSYITVFYLKQKSYAR